VSDALQVRCPDCRKRLFDLAEKTGTAFCLVIACRCRNRYRVELPNPDGTNLPLLVRA